jgi:hypothetical protein
MPSHILSEKDTNAHFVQMGSATADRKPDLKSMEYHRQVLQSKMEQEQYVEPRSYASFQ